MPSLRDAYALPNLERAWRWVRSNPDAQFKGYFRDLYSVYSIAESAALAELSDRLKRGVYQPAHVCKLYIPKPSGVLRPYTLMSVEDQIVYQAAANVVAECHFLRAGRRYLKDTFGHLYAGKSSTWFYRKWSDGYVKFNEAMRQTHARGFRFAASFDLTACYDSLDHNVLKHFLQRLGCDNEFCDTLTGWLRHWTATNATQRIYHGHGIPQGPLGSGLLAEIVLSYFDVERGKHRSVVYLRYIDDIRLLARSERALREMVVRLDMLSKDIGLFPQSSKIEIHEIKDVEDELKSVSRPPEPSIRRRRVNQVRLRRRVLELCRRAIVQKPTRWKYLLAHATPSAKLNLRMIAILRKQPALYGNVLRYFRRYELLPRRVVAELIRELRNPSSPYPSITAEILDTLCGRVRDAEAIRIDEYVRTNWKPTRVRADLLAAMGKWALPRGILSFGRVERALDDAGEWWARTQLVKNLDDRVIGKASLAGLLNDRLRDPSPDVAMVAASRVVQYAVPITGKRSTLNPRAQFVLREFGVLSRGPGRRCGIEQSMSRLLGASVRGINWRTICAGRYRRMERQAVWARAYADSNITAFVNAMDVFNDSLLSALYAHDPTLGTYNLGQIGSVLGSPRLRTKYPAVHAMVEDIHEKRRESYLSHVIVRGSGQYTRPIKHSYRRRARKLMIAAFGELWAKW
jgi:hypothetical protein